MVTAIDATVAHRRVERHHGGLWRIAANYVGILLPFKLCTKIPPYLFWIKDAAANQTT